MTHTQTRSSYYIKIIIIIFPGIRQTRMGAVSTSPSQGTPPLPSLRRPLLSWRATRCLSRWWSPSCMGWGDGEGDGDHHHVRSSVIGFRLVDSFSEKKYCWVPWWWWRRQHVFLPTCHNGLHDHLHSVMSMHFWCFFLSLFKNVLHFLSNWVTVSV